MESLETLLAAAMAAAERGESEQAQLLAQQILDRGADHTDRIKTSVSHPDAEVRRLTIMFCDLVGSTSMSTRHSPEVYYQIVRRYHRTCRRIIEDRYEGFVANYIGDGVLALFGHPHSHEDDSRRAVKAGLDIIEALKPVSADVLANFGQQVEARIAVHNGVVYLDLVENDVYSAAPNLSARLQDRAETNTVVISQELHDVVGDFFQCRIHGPVTLKGFEEPVNYYTVDGEAPESIRRGRRWSSPLTGRDEQLSLLNHAIHASRSGSGSGSILISGDSGIGKSRLVDALQTDLGESALTLVCSPYGKDVGLHPFQEAIHTAAGIDGTSPGNERLISLRAHIRQLGLEESTVPLLAAVATIPPEAGYESVEADPRLLRSQIRSALRSWLAKVLPHWGGLLVVEDLHWADSSTLELVQSLLLDQLDRTFTLVTCRADGEPSWLRESVAATVELGPLSTGAANVLASLIDEKDKLSSAQRTELVELSDGIPLYLEELVSTAAMGRDRPAADLRKLTSSPAVPPALYDPLLARLSQPGIDVEFVQLAATVGREFGFDLLAAVTNTSDETFRRNLRTLIDAGVITDVKDKPGIARFRHALIREMAYHLQPAENRTGAHLLVAQALRSRAELGEATDWALVALHFAEGADPAQAIDAYERASDSARLRGSLDEARAHLDRAIELLSLGPADPIADVDLRLKRSFVAASMEGNWSETAIRDHEHCLEVCAQDESNPQYFNTLIITWANSLARGNPHRSRWVSTIMRDLVTRYYPDWEPENIASYGMIDFFFGEYSKSASRLRSAVAMLPESGADERVLGSWYLPNDPQAAMHTHFGVTSWYVGDSSRSAIHLDTAVHRARTLPFPQGPVSTTYALNYIAILALEKCDFNRAERAVSDLERIAAETGLGGAALYAATNRAALEAQRILEAPGQHPEDLKKHIHVMSSVIDKFESVGAKNLLPYNLTWLSRVLIGAGDLKGATDLLDRAINLAKETDLKYYLAESLRLRSACSGNDRDLLRAFEVAQEQGALVFALRAALDLGKRASHPSTEDELQQLSGLVGAFPAQADYPELGEAAQVSMMR